MVTIGQIIEQTIDYSDRGLYDLAFVQACEVIRRTSEKVYEKEELAEPTFQRFIRENWEMISLMSVTRNLKIPSDVPFAIRQSLPGNVGADSMLELVIYAVRQTLVMNRLPIALGFIKTGGTIVEGEQLLLPRSLIFALIAIAVVNPVNKAETIGDKYWLNIWDFKMFISELWGRNDLAKRIMDLYYS